MRFLNFLSIIGLLFALASCSNSGAEVDAVMEACDYDSDCVYSERLEHEGEKQWEKFEGKDLGSGAMFTKAKVAGKVVRIVMQVPPSVLKLPVKDGKARGQQILDGFHELFCGSGESPDASAVLFFRNGSVLELNLLTETGKLYSSKRITSCDNLK